MATLDDRALTYVAEYFQALAEPMRLKLLHALQDGEKNVGELTAISGCTQANVSKHLSLLAKLGMVRREARGTNVFYGIADPSIYNLCDLVCGHVGKHLSAQLDMSELFSNTQPKEKS